MPSVIEGNDRIPVLVDTDIGSDIDDAVALAYLLGEPRCELVAITTVTGDVERRAACAGALCAAMGRPETPIITGLGDPLVFGPGQPDVPHYRAIAGRFPTIPVTDGAVEYLGRVLRARPGEITLLSIGPFTNVAALCAHDPGTAGMLGGCISMSGRFDGVTTPDRNAAVDPVATAIAYGRLPPGHHSVSLDITRHVTLTAGPARKAFARIPPLAAMAGLWFESRDDITLHDPLAAALIFRPELCRYEDGEVAIDLGPQMAGLTRFTSGGSRRHRITVGVKAAEAREHIVSVIAGAQT